MAMKKGFFFTFDAFLAIILFILILFGLFSYYISAKSLTQQYYYSEDLLSVLSNVKINELDFTIYDDPSGMDLIDLIELDYIENQDVTIMEQISTFYAINQEENAKTLTKSITDGLIPENYGFGVFIRGKEIYQGGKENISALVSRQRIVKGASIEF